MIRDIDLKMPWESYGEEKSQCFFAQMSRKLMTRRDISMGGLLVPNFARYMAAAGPPT